MNIEQGKYYLQMQENNPYLGEILEMFHFRVEDEELLQQQLYEGKITWLEYVQQSEHSEEFRQYCQDNGLPEDNQTAQQFRDWQLKEEEQVHTVGLD